MKKSQQLKIQISIHAQRLTLRSGRKKVTAYPVSTSRFGLGSKEGSFKTPTGKFRVAEKIGEGTPCGTVFKSRRPVKPTRKMLRVRSPHSSCSITADSLAPRAGATEREHSLALRLHSRHKPRGGRRHARQSWLRSNEERGRDGAFRSGYGGDAGRDQALTTVLAPSEKSREKRCVMVLNCLNDGSNLQGKGAKHT